jgi:hypothetical protein
MIVALDYDCTYTNDPATWDKVIAVFRAAGHKVYLVTMRYDNHTDADPVRAALEGKVDGMFFTGHRAKQPFMFKLGINISVWIDDMPGFILYDAREG